jgi:DNA polymerase-3 subunit beta
MKFTIDQSVLSSGLNRIQSAISSKPTIPILGNVLISATGSNITIKATDLDISLITTIECDVIKEGSATIPAKKLTAIIKQLPSAPVTIETDENYSSSISCNKSFFKILGLSDVDFPSDSDFKPVAEITFDCISMKKALDKISYSVSSDVTRQVLNGVLFSIRDNSLSLVATDGRRLALMEVSIATDIIDIDLIIPNKSVNELQKLLANSSDVDISIGESRIKFTTQGTTFISKITEGKYPNYKQVIPKSFNDELSIPRNELSKAINRVSLVLSDLSSSIKMDIKNDSVIVSAASNTDESSEPVSVEFTGSLAEISFNPTFIQDPLKSLDCNNVSIHFNDRNSPMCITGDEGFTYIIMPMRN